MSDRPKPSIERAYTEVRLAQEAVDAAYRSLQSARRRFDDAMATFQLIHPGNPVSPYAPTVDMEEPHE